jgi:hypothetical protein
MTLHEAMAAVLADSRAGWLDTRSIAITIARRALFRRRDGLPPPVNDVSARVSTYASWFKREGSLVRLI